MISVMMSNNSNKVFEAGRRIDSEQDAAAGDLSRVSVNGVVGDDETRSSNSKSFSIEKVEDSIGFVEARVSNDCSSNNNNDNSDVSLVLDVKGSAEARVSEEVKERTDVCVSEIKRDAEKSNVNEQKSCSGKKEMEGKVEEKSKVVESQNGKTERKKSNLSDYNSMLSMFDEFAQSGNRWAVGYGYEIGDMVWGKVKSHPWWPGHIYNEAFASPSVRRIKTEGHVLVAFFGDSSYGWFDPAELIPFEPNFAEKSKQMNSRSFMKAVEEAVDEVSRRSGLGLACRCRNPYNFRPTRVEGFFAVDVGDYEPGEIFSASQIKTARDSFQPQEMLAFVKQLALNPRSSDYENINFIKRKASVLMYRKAVFEEFDETYAQAFGAQPVRPEPKTAADLSREPSRAPLSGPLVVAEALGKGKASGKSAKAKDQVEKDRYLFKRRDESNQLKAQKATQGQPGPSSKPIQTDGRISGKGMYMSMADQVPRTIGSNVAEVFGQPSDHSVPVEARGHGENHRTAGDPKLHAEGSKKQTEVGPKKVKVHKRPAGEMSSKDSGSVEKKKKRKKEFGMQMSSESTQVPTVAGKVGASVVKVAEKLVQITPAAEVDLKMDNQGKDLVGKLVQVPLAVEGGDLKMENQKKDDSASASVLPPQQTVDVSNTVVELGQLLTDLRALALNPFHGVERSCPLMLQKVFLKFRSLVYQKSLVSLEPNETESSETHTGRSPAIAAISDDARVEHVKEMSVKPQKPSSRLEDPTLGGRKRGPSDRQEEMAAKKKKKVSDLKSLAAEKKAAQKATEAPRADTKEMAVKPAVPTSKAVRPEAVKKTEVVAKEPDPTMLIMKFPPGGALPSHAELKAKFARFGPLDPNKIRVYWQSSQCRLVYQHKSHAQAALKFATGSNSPFGNASVRCYLRDLSVEMPESESAKVLKKEDSSVGASQSREPVVEQRQAAKLASQPLQPPVQLKSCLKRPSGEEGSSVNGGNGGGVRGARVKFMLGGEESSRSEHVTVGNRNSDNSASFADGGASSSSSHATTMEFSSKNFQRVIPPSSQLSSSAFPLPTAQLPKPPPNNMHYNEAVSRNLVDFNTPPAPPPVPGTANIDITQQMLSLLTKCNDVVTNLTGLLGYAPYHPL